MAGKARVYSGKRRKKLLWKCRVFSTPAEITRGIMGEKPGFQPAFFVLPFSGRLANSIHSLFCPAFYAVFLDEKLRVVDVRGVKPFRLLVVPSSRCKYLIEVPWQEASRKPVKNGAKLIVEVMVGRKWKPIQ